MKDKTIKQNFYKAKEDFKKWDKECENIISKVRKDPKFVELIEELIYEAIHETKNFEEFQKKVLSIYYGKIR
jgi:hypothetical protein